MPEVFDANKENLLEKAREFVEEKLHPLEAVNHYSSVMRNEQPSSSPFDAFAPKPLTIHAFDSQLQDEQVLLLLRQHPITQIGKVLIIIAMLVFPFFFPYVS